MSFAFILNRYSGRDMDFLPLGQEMLWGPPNLASNGCRKIPAGIVYVVLKALTLHGVMLLLQDILCFILQS